MEEEYLAHYGVLGMKWGVRHDRERAYARAVKKKNKLDAKAAKADEKAKKARAHTPSRLHRVTDLGIAYYDRRMRSINAKEAKAAKASIKAEKWVKSMERVFSETPLSEIME